MPRKGITESDVAAAMESIIAEGEAASADAVLRRLGTGSKATVLKFMRAIRSHLNKDPVVDAPSEPLPEDLEEALSSAAAAWYASVRRKLGDQADLANQQLDGRRRELDSLEKDALALFSRSEEVEETNRGLRLEVAALKGENLTWERELRSAQQALATATGATAAERSRADCALADLKEGREELSKSVELRISLERQNSSLSVGAR